MSQPPRNKRRKGREAALQLLYASDLEGELRDGQHRDAFWDLCQVKPSGKEFAETLVQGVLDHLIEIDTRIERTLHNYEFHRLAAVDRNILRLAAYEILFAEDVPDGVAINEAIEIAKDFGTDESGKFVNGVLDRIRKDSSLATPDPVPHPPVSSTSEEDS